MIDVNCLKFLVFLLNSILFLSLRHIFPASRWVYLNFINILQFSKGLFSFFFSKEPYDPEKKWDGYTIKDKN
jgi:hypothetical protein